METNYIFGIRAVQEALAAGKEIEKVLVKKGTAGDLFTVLMAQLHQAEVPVQYVPYEAMQKITTANHQGVIAYLAPIKFQELENLIPPIVESGKNPLVLVLDGITDVRNFGAIVRSAECSGVDVIVVPEKGSARINHDAVKTSAGALLKIPVCRARSMMKAVTYLQQMGLQAVVASEKSDMAYTEYNFNQPIALIMGAEDKGPSRDLLKIADQVVSIPLRGTIGSLNVSVAAGVLLFECVRQSTK